MPDSNAPQALQDRYAPKNRCFGCGPSNEKGLRLKSVPPAPGAPGSDGTGEVLCEWNPEAHHEAFEGMLNGGICGALLDCHSNWTAAWHLMHKASHSIPPCTVTAEFHVKLKKPTPTNQTLLIRAKVVESSERKAVVEATLEAAGVVTTTCRGIFVAVREGHPAYHRW